MRSRQLRKAISQLVLDIPKATGTQKEKEHESDIAEPGKGSVGLDTETIDVIVDEVIIAGPTLDEDITIVPADIITRDVATTVTGDITEMAVTTGMAVTTEMAVITGMAVITETGPGTAVTEMRQISR